LKKILLIAFLALFLAVVVAPTAFAMAGEPVAGCPKGFELMMVMDHEDPMHQHIGTMADQNGDGWVCMRHITDERHLHIDNTVPFE